MASDKNLSQLLVIIQKAVVLAAIALYPEIVQKPTNTPKINIAPD